LQVDGWYLTYEKIQESGKDDHVHPPQERHLHIGLANDGKQYYLDFGSGLFLQQSHRFDCKEKSGEIHFRQNTTDTELPVGQVMRFNLCDQPITANGSDEVLADKSNTIYGAEEVKYFGNEPVTVYYYISGKKEPYRNPDEATVVSPSNCQTSDASQKANKSSEHGSLELPPAFRANPL
jgi:hypothetical protein